MSEEVKIVEEKTDKEIVEEKTLSEKIDAIETPQDAPEPVFEEQLEKYSPIEYKVIHDALGKLPVTLEGDTVARISYLREKIAHDFEIVQKREQKQAEKQ